MSLTRIDPADFVFSNDALSTSCWKDENGDPVGDTSTTPSFSSQIISETGWGGIITNYYIGDQGNLQFSVFNGVNKTAQKEFVSRKIYGALRNIVYGDKNAVFKWGGIERPIFNVISVSKNIPLPLLPGSLRIGQYTDDSKINPPTILNCGRAYNLVTATISPGGIFNFGTGTTVQGLFLPDVGLILSHALLSTSTFILSTANPTPTNHVFIRARNTQYNYSMNPSFISGSSGKIINQEWFDNPQTYITSVGLYNDNNELMATAKLPRPYNKNFYNELLMQVGLNF
jgi:hypothetical protein